MNTAKTLSDHAAVAKLIRVELKKRGIKGTVRSESYSMGNSVTANVMDLPPAQYAALQAFVEQFQYGQFNGSEDIYEYTNRRDDIPQVKFTFVQNRISDELRAEITAYANSRGLIYANEECENSQIVHQFFNGVRVGFWTNGGTAKAAA